MKQLSVPVLAVIGWSDSGKTTFVNELIKTLHGWDYQIASIKHNAHKFEIDKPGKDSWQHRQAGAQAVLISSAGKMALIEEVEEQPEVETMVSDYIGDAYDLVLVEGYKSGSVPQIEVFRPEIYETPVKETSEVLARVVNNGSKSDLKQKARSLAKKVEQIFLSRQV